MRAAVLDNSSPFAGSVPLSLLADHKPSIPTRAERLITILEDPVTSLCPSLLALDELHGHERQCPLLLAASYLIAVSSGGRIVGRPDGAVSQP